MDKSRIGSKQSQAPHNLIVGRGKGRVVCIKPCIQFSVDLAIYLEISRHLSVTKCIAVNCFHNRLPNSIRWRWRRKEILEKEKEENKYKEEKNGRKRQKKEGNKNQEMVGLHQLKVEMMRKKKKDENGN